MHQTTFRAAEGALDANQTIAEADRLVAPVAGAMPGASGLSS
jgi:hypothetical protein